MGVERSALVSLCILASVGQGCSDQHVERFATREESERVQFVVCATELPATALVWELGPNKIIGDADDSLLWSSDGPWSLRIGALATWSRRLTGRKV